MPDDPLVAGLDVKFGTLDFGIETSGFDINLDAPLAPTASSNNSSKQADQQHGLMSKMEQYGSNSTVAQQPPAASSLPKPDPAMGGFTSSVPSAAPSMVTAAPQAKPTPSPASYPYGVTSYAPPGVNSSASQSANSAAAQPAGAYPSTTQTSKHSSFYRTQTDRLLITITLQVEYTTTATRPARLTKPTTVNKHPMAVTLSSSSNNNSSSSSNSNNNNSNSNSNSSNSSNSSSLLPTSRTTIS